MTAESAAQRNNGGLKSTELKSKKILTATLFTSFFHQKLMLNSAVIARKKID
jgi:hypothetical protein